MLAFKGRRLFNKPSTGRSDSRAWDFSRFTNLRFDPLRRLRNTGAIFSLG
jgi:hypothetical protein